MKKNKKTKEAILEQMRKVPIIEIACQKTNISRMTLSRWRKDDPEFSKQIDVAISEGRQLINDLAESGLIGAVKDRSLPAILQWLKFHHNDYRDKLEISGKLETTHELSPEQKELARRAMNLIAFMQPNTNNNTTKDHDKS